VEVERLYQDWEIALDWAPFLLDPSVPPEGKERRPQTAADTPKSHLEERGESLGIEFRRGRTFVPNTRPALQAAEFAREHGTTEQVIDYHRRLFKAYFTDFENLMDVEVLVHHAEPAGLDAAAMREALETGRYADQVEQGIADSYNRGVSAIPTFIIEDRYAVEGAQDYSTFEKVMERLGVRRREA
jgi:predicted DsbA family dithiol-disulfide isomerase